MELYRGYIRQCHTDSLHDSAFLFPIPLYLYPYISLVSSRLPSLLLIMSFTYMHYSTSSSLPSDYALLSRYSAANNLDQQLTGPTEDEDIEAADHSDDDSLTVGSLPIPGRGSASSPRRTSFPTPYVTPFNPTTGPLPDRSGFRSGPHLLSPNENTPLLSPLVPRIQEEVDGDGPTSEPASNLLWEEACILAKYTLPVSGSVHSFLTTITTLLTVAIPSP